MRHLRVYGFTILLVATPLSAEDPSLGLVAPYRQQKSGLPPAGYLDNSLIPGQKWRVHDIARPEPSVITPGRSSTQEAAGTPPSDAIVLFDGTDLSEWTNDTGEPADWTVTDGYMEVNGAGSILTKKRFGSCQLHIEWATPSHVEGKSQGRGNSGVILMGLYEVQVLDSYQNRTYSDGQAAAIYGQYPPQFNVSRPPGQWQTYDVVFTAPVFEGETLIRPTYFTVLHNGVLVHNHVAGAGRVAHKDPPSYTPHAEALPLTLQDHGNPVRFRNIWVRPL